MFWGLYWEQDLWKHRRLAWPLDHPVHILPALFLFWVCQEAKGLKPKPTYRGAMRAAFDQTLPPAAFGGQDKFYRLAGAGQYHIDLAATVAGGRSRATIWSLYSATKKLSYFQRPGVVPEYLKGLRPIRTRTKH
jgi:hypothetical protein